MATGIASTIINGLPVEIRTSMNTLVDFLQNSWRFGDGKRATSALLYKVDATTATIANQEFSVLHNLESIPSKLVPVLDLTAIGSQLVTLTVTRAPDIHRVYLSSPTAGAAIQFYVE